MNQTCTVTRLVFIFIIIFMYWSLRNINKYTAAQNWAFFYWTNMRRSLMQFPMLNIRTFQREFEHFSLHLLVGIIKLFLNRVNLFIALHHGHFSNIILLQEQLWSAEAWSLDTWWWAVFADDYVSLASCEQGLLWSWIACTVYPIVAWLD